MPGENPKWAIRECREQSDLERLFNFRYVEYVGKKGVFRDTADHGNQLLTDPVDTFAINFGAFSANGEVVGSIRINGFDQLVQSFCITEFHIMEVSPQIFTKGCIVTRAMVREDWRASPVFVDLALTAARKMRDTGLRWMFIDTATSRKSGEEERFISLYRSMGFKIWRQDAELPGIGPGAVMMFDLEEALADPKSLANLYLRTATVAAAS